jgi:nicotinamide-nucleotide amidase
VSTTGVAGPDPQDGHPVGQVYVAVSHQTSDVLRVKELLLQGERAAIRQQAAMAALALLADSLGSESASVDVGDATET